MTESDIGTTSDLMQEVIDIVAAEAMIDRDKLSATARLDELDIQSADYVMILMAVEERFGVYISIDSGFTEAETVGDLVRAVAAKIAEGSGAGA
ncbi:putative Acyl carrier protein [Pseudorhizobium banfieldiae]|uniref:Putative Acyl carrier protein n=2 Tax=Pseudorhizobium banfieldiae TaxID=1125847 RepID=L0NDC5_9HYPH|nr:acyl carrier protein [arsenite-oxidising bacterium NT-25]CCF18307.1 putative Acyl carrier protein [Pseudorhizobium banfieldiae]